MYRFVLCDTIDGVYLEFLVAWMTVLIGDVKIFGTLIEQGLLLAVLISTSVAISFNCHVT